MKTEQNASEIQDTKAQREDLGVVNMHTQNLCNGDAKQSRRFKPTNENRLRHVT